MWKNALALQKGLKERGFDIGKTDSVINAIGLATSYGQLSGGNYYFAGGGGSGRATNLTGTVVNTGGGGVGQTTNGYVNISWP